MDNNCILSDWNPYKILSSMVTIPSWGRGHLRNEVRQLLIIRSGLYWPPIRTGLDPTNSKGNFRAIKRHSKTYVHQALAAISMNGTYYQTRIWRPHLLLPQLNTAVKQPLLNWDLKKQKHIQLKIITFQHTRQRNKILCSMATCTTRFNESCSKLIYPVTAK